MVINLLGLFGPVIYKGVEYPNVKMKWSAMFWGPIASRLIDHYISFALFMAIFVGTILYFKIFHWRLKRRKQGKKAPKLDFFDKIYIGGFYFLCFLALLDQTRLFVNLALKKDPWLLPWDTRTHYEEPMSEEEVNKIQEKMRQEEIERIKKNMQKQKDVLIDNSESNLLFPSKKNTNNKRITNAEEK